MQLGNNSSNCILRQIVLLFVHCSWQLSLFMTSHLSTGYAKDNSNSSKSKIARTSNFFWSSKKFPLRLLIHRLFLAYYLLKACVHLCKTVMLWLLQCHDRTSQKSRIKGPSFYKVIYLDNGIEWIHVLYWKSPYCKCRRFFCLILLRNPER